MGEWACYPTTSRRIGHIKINDSVNLRPTQPNLSPQHPSLPHRLTPWAYPCPTGDLPRGSHSGAERRPRRHLPGVPGNPVVGVGEQISRLRKYQSPRSLGPASRCIHSPTPAEKCHREKGREKGDASILKR